MMNNSKCIKYNCYYYFNSDDYFETCKLLDKYILLDKCYGIEEVPNKQIEIASKIQKLTQEFDRLCLLENWVKDNQS